MKPAIKVAVSKAGYGKRGQLFNSSIDGRRIVSSSTTPFLDAARVLLNEGVNPETPIFIFHEGCSYYSLKSTVGKVAKLTVLDSGHGPIFRPWRALSAVPVGSSVPRADGELSQGGDPTARRRHDRDTGTTPLHNR